MIDEMFSEYQIRVTHDYEYNCEMNDCKSGIKANLKSFKYGLQQVFITTTMYQM